VGPDVLNRSNHVHLPDQVNNPIPDSSLHDIGNSSSSGEDDFKKTITTRGPINDDWSDECNSLEDDSSSAASEGSACMNFRIPTATIRDSPSRSATGPIRKISCVDIDSPSGSTIAGPTNINNFWPSNGYDFGERKSEDPVWVPKVSLSAAKVNLTVPHISSDDSAVSSPAVDTPTGRLQLSSDELLSEDSRAKLDPVKIAEHAHGRPYTSSEKRNSAFLEDLERLTTNVEEFSFEQPPQQGEAVETSQDVSEDSQSQEILFDREESMVPRTEVAPQKATQATSTKSAGDLNQSSSGISALMRATDSSSEGELQDSGKSVVHAGEAPVLFNSFSHRAAIAVEILTFQKTLKVAGMHFSPWGEPRKRFQQNSNFFPVQVLEIARRKIMGSGKIMGSRHDANYLQLLSVLGTDPAVDILAKRFYEFVNQNRLGIAPFDVLNIRQEMENARQTLWEEVHKQRLASQAQSLIKNSERILARTKETFMNGRPGDAALPKPAGIKAQYSRQRSPLAYHRPVIYFTFSQAGLLGVMAAGWYTTYEPMHVLSDSRGSAMYLRLLHSKYAIADEQRVYAGGIDLIPDVHWKDFSLFSRDQRLAQTLTRHYSNQWASFCCNVFNKKIGIVNIFNPLEYNRRSCTKKVLQHLSSDARRAFEKVSLIDLDSESKYAGGKAPSWSRVAMPGGMRTIETHLVLSGDDIQLGTGQALVGTAKDDLCPPDNFVPLKQNLDYIRTVDAYREIIGSAVIHKRKHRHALDAASLSSSAGDDDRIILGGAPQKPLRFKSDDGYDSDSTMASLHLGDSYNRGSTRHSTATSGFSTDRPSHFDSVMRLVSTPWSDETSSLTESSFEVGDSSSSEEVGDSSFESTRFEHKRKTNHVIPQNRGDFDDDDEDYEEEITNHELDYIKNGLKFPQIPNSETVQITNGISSTQDNAMGEHNLEEMRQLEEMRRIGTTIDRLGCSGKSLTDGVDLAAILATVSQESQTDLTQIRNTTPRNADADIATEPKALALVNSALGRKALSHTGKARSDAPTFLPLVSPLRTFPAENVASEDASDSSNLVPQVAGDVADLMSQWIFGLPPEESSENPFASTRQMTNPSDPISSRNRAKPSALVSDSELDFSDLHHRSRRSTPGLPNDMILESVHEKEVDSSRDESPGIFGACWGQERKKNAGTRSSCGAGAASQAEAKLCGVGSARTSCSGSLAVVLPFSACGGICKDSNSRALEDPYSRASRMKRPNFNPYQFVAMTKKTGASFPDILSLSVRNQGIHLAQKVEGIEASSSVSLNDQTQTEQIISRLDDFILIMNQYFAVSGVHSRYSAVREVYTLDPRCAPESSHATDPTQETDLGTMASLSRSAVLPMQEGSGPPQDNDVGSMQDDDDAMEESVENPLPSRLRNKNTNPIAGFLLDKLIETLLADPESKFSISIFTSPASVLMQQTTISLECFAIAAEAAWKLYKLPNTPEHHIGVFIVAKAWVDEDVTDVNAEKTPTTKQDHPMPDQVDVQTASYQSVTSSGAEKALKLLYSPANGNPFVQVSHTYESKQEPLFPDDVATQRSIRRHLLPTELQSKDDNSVANFRGGLDPFFFKFRSRFVHAKLVLTKYGGFYSSANLNDRSLNVQQVSGLPSDAELGVILKDISSIKSKKHQEHKKSSGSAPGILFHDDSERKKSTTTAFGEAETFGETESVITTHLRSALFLPWVEPMLQELLEGEKELALPTSGKLSLLQILSTVSHLYYEKLGRIQCGPNNPPGGVSCPAKQLERSEISMLDFLAPRFSEKEKYTEKTRKIQTMSVLEVFDKNPVEVPRINYYQRQEISNGRRRLTSQKELSIPEGIFRTRFWDGENLVATLRKNGLANVPTPLLKNALDALESQKTSLLPDRKPYMTREDVADFEKTNLYFKRPNVHGIHA